ncbi:MFS transporter [Ectothiorhodospiraceae bacterium WFHF3C12]|nr:MFS transporter [Ectothiorhodospiraceae bacterium WFHF3C12]
MSETAPQTPRPNAVLMVTTGMFVTLVVIVFARLAFGLIVPPMREGLDLSYEQAGYLGTITALGYLSFVLVGGMAAARWGARWTVVMGVSAVGLGFLGLSQVGTYWHAVPLMAVLGFGTAFSFAPMVSLLATWYPEKRGLVIGLLTSGVGIGLLVAGVLVPWLNGLFGEGGWRATWGVFAATAFVVAFLVAAFVRDPPAARLAEGERPPSADKWAVYTNPRVLTVAVVYGIVGLTYIVQSVFMVSFMVEAGFEAALAGSLVSVSGIISIGSSPLWGLVSDRMGRGSALMAAMATVTVGMGLPVFSQTLPAFVAHYVLMGCAVSGMFAMIQAAGTEQVPARYVPIAFSFVTLFFAGGQLVGPAVAGWLIEYTGDFRAAFGFTCLGLALGVYLTNRIRHFPREAAELHPRTKAEQEAC